MRIANKYKPHAIADFCMNNSTKSMLALMVKCDELKTLLVGNSASGKTTLIDAIIREYYNLDPKTSATTIRSNPDVLYLNSVLNQGVNSAIAHTRSFCQARCDIPNLKKIVVIDDLDLIIDTTQQIVHWMVDQFGPKVHFIASCTNLRSVSNLALSSFLHIEIPPRTKVEMHAIFKTITDGERLSVSDDAAQFIVSIAQTDINALTHYAEKLMFVGKPITEKIARDTCTAICFSTLNAFFDSVAHNNIELAAKQITDIANRGSSGMDILDAMLMYTKCADWFRDCGLFSDPELVQYTILGIIGKYIASSCNMNMDELELVFFANELCMELQKQ